jgi:hypothetical protein
LTARGTTAPSLRPGHRRWLLTVPGLAGVGYSLSWIAGLAVPALAVLAAAAATMTALPRWLRWTGIALAVAITCSGLVYLLLIAPLTAAAGPALVLLLAFMTGCGIVTGMTAGRRDR